MTARALFGGAMIATVPARLQDISEVRQVPDSQEVRCWSHLAVSAPAVPCGHL